MISSVAIDGTMVTINKNDHQVNAGCTPQSAFILVSGKTFQISNIGLVPFLGNFTEQIIPISFHDLARFIIKSFLTSVTNRLYLPSDEMIYNKLW